MATDETLPSGQEDPLAHTPMQEDTQEYNVEEQPSGVSPTESYDWASSQIKYADTHQDFPHELLGIAHMVVQLYFVNTQLNLIARLLAAPMEDAEASAGN